MKEAIDAKIEAWQAAVQQLQMRRQQLTAELGEIDTTIQRHIGAIVGAQELLQELNAPSPASAAANQPEESC